MNQELKDQAHKEFTNLFGYEISEVQKEFPKYLSHDPDIWNFIDSLIDKTVQKTEERIENKWRGKIKFAISRISGSEYEERQIWRDFIKKLKEFDYE